MPRKQTAFFPILLLASLFTSSSSSSLDEILSTSRRVCTSRDWTQGKWVQGAYERCGLLETYDASIAPKHWSRYCWVPEHCSFEKFSPSSFCKALRNRSIAFVGVSAFYSAYNNLSLPNDTICVG